MTKEHRRFSLRILVFSTVLSLCGSLLPPAASARPASNRHNLLAPVAQSERISANAPSRENDHQSTYHRSYRGKEPGPEMAAELFISEYIEGSSNNKAIEIYNGTGASVNLMAGNYQLLYFFNGSATAGLTITLTGTVADGDVYVVAQASANPTILAQADQTNGSGWFNGDDAVVLRKNGITVDAIGQVGSDPGTEWGTGVVSTADNTIRRKSTVCMGETVDNDLYDPAPEWDGFVNDTFGGLGSHTASCGGGTTLSVNDVSQMEGDSGTSTFLFTVSLSAPAGPGGVTFDIATQNNTATTMDNDYVMNSLTGQTIPMGNSMYPFSVTVNGDMAVEANETFFVNVTNIVGATAADAQGTGTIGNDDVTITPIHDIQGPGASSPIPGASVVTRGIVTGRKSNGFFLQEPDASVDADPATSEGIFVFTSSAPPAAAAVGNLVQVSGTVTEFVPSADPLQPPLTELTSPAVLQLMTGQPLPAAIPLTATFPDPAGPFDQLERVEGMRVQVASLTVCSATLGSVNEPNASATSIGVFQGVVTGVPRPFREAGIQAPDPAPSGSIPPIPRFDSNPERIAVDSDGQPGGTALDVATGAIVTGVVGPLDYSFRTYTIMQDLGAALSAVGGITPTAVSTPATSEFTVASYNLERFFDTVNDPGIGEPVLTTTAFNARLAKASLGIRDFLKTPDILGIVECENLTTLQALATQINNDAVLNSQPNPMYVAFLVEGNDIGGIDVGFLVKTAPVVGATPRVGVVSVTQEGLTTTYVDPTDGSTDLLNDRPPLVLEAIVSSPTGAAFPVTVIVNHMRSLNGVDDPVPSGMSTGGNRVRVKRRAQAEFLANLVQARQVADPAESIVLVGDFNAFEFNDGYVDSMGTIQGTPTAATDVVLASPDLVNPDLINLFDTAPAPERYSFVFTGSAQSLDHVVINQVLDTAATSRVEHPRINADFPEIARNGTDVRRLADHDPIVAFFDVTAFGGATVTGTKTVSGTFAEGGVVTYTVVLTNNSDGTQADNPGHEFTDTLPSQLAATMVTATSGSTGASTGNTVAWNGSLAPGASVTITITATINAGTGGQTVSNQGSISYDSDGNGTNDATAMTDDPATGTPNDPTVFSIALTCSAPISVTASAVAACEFGASVTYPSPGIDAVCVPASGSFFPVGTTTVTCTSAGSGEQCTFTVTVSLSAGGFACARDDDSGDSFTQIVDTASPIYGYWQYYVAENDALICGQANKVTYRANRSLVSSDTDYSAENPFYFMSANLSWSTKAGIVSVTDRRTGKKYTLRDRNILDSSCTN